MRDVILPGTQFSVLKQDRRFDDELNCMEDDPPTPRHEGCQSTRLESIRKREIPQEVNTPKLVRKGTLKRKIKRRSTTKIDRIIS
jgi:hypothetical protein